jgi:tetratricopeptide (TPR) repeat protein
VSKLAFLPWTRCLILLALVALLLGRVSGPSDRAAVKDFEQGEELAAGGQGINPSSAAAYQRASARRPLDPQPWRRLGDLYTAQGHLDLAQQAYDAAQQRGDASTALERSLAHLYTLRGDDQRATRHWETYLERQPTDRTARLTLAQVALRQANWERARAQLERLLADDSDPLAQAWLGLLLLGSDQEAALAHLALAAQDAAQAAYLAPVLEALAPPFSGPAPPDPANTAGPSNDPAYRQTLLGAALLELAGPAQSLPEQAAATLALRSLLYAAYRSPYAEAYAYLGQALDKLGYAGWARAALEYALRLSPQSPTALTLAGLYWDRHDDPAQARQYYESAYEHNPGNAALALEIAATYAAEGQYTAAEVWLFGAVQSAPHDPLVWQTLGHFYLDSGIGIQESGLPVALQLVEMAPHSAHAHDMLGWAYFLTQQDQRALASLNQALALDPTLASAHFHLGRWYARQGQYADAAQAYRQAGALDTAGQLREELERAWSELPVD